MLAARLSEDGRPGVPRRGRARTTARTRRALAGGHARRPPARVLARLGDRPRGPLAAARADHRRLLGPQRLHPAPGRARGLRRVGPRLEPRGDRALPAAGRARAARAPDRARGAVAVAPRVRRRGRRRRDPASGQRGRHGPLEHRLRLPRPGARAREPDDPRRHARRPRPARRRPRGRASRRPRGSCARRPSCWPPAPTARRGSCSAAASARSASCPSARASSDHVGVGLGFAGTERLQRETAEFERARPLFMAQVTVPLASRGCAPGLCDLFFFPGLDPPGERGYEASVAVFAMKPRVARRGAPDLARPARAARDRPRLPVGPARRRGARRGRRGAARRSPAATSSAPTPAASERPGAAVDARDTRERERARASSIPSAPARSAASSTATAACSGSTGSYVADASIMPTIPRANTNLSTIALAERLAEVIR